MEMPRALFMIVSHGLKGEVKNNGRMEVAYPPANAANVAMPFSSLKVVESVIAFGLQCKIYRFP